MRAPARLDACGILVAAIAEVSALAIWLIAGALGKLVALTADAIWLAIWLACGMLLAPRADVNAPGKSLGMAVPADGTALGPAGRLNEDKAELRAPARLEA